MSNANIAGTRDEAMNSILPAQRVEEREVEDCEKMLPPFLSSNAVYNLLAYLDAGGLPETVWRTSHSVVALFIVSRLFPVKNPHLALMSASFEVVGAHPARHNALMLTLPTRVVLSENYERGSPLVNDIASTLSPASVSQENYRVRSPEKRVAQPAPLFVTGRPSSSDAPSPAGPGVGSTCGGGEMGVAIEQRGQTDYEEAVVAVPLQVSAVGVRYEW
ncbi:hypothetical protein NLJ89_g10028 [Agrocybe chaxingu]|uniref:Uncharacterized protein n=1 Tax=Agrocybe chaxingu TaxID=84603 RepID=A0A9W8MRA0_9AGAR|nr:hypothetical protein NLJ89_g10028 [Agrocybe chaxingu]